MTRFNQPKNQTNPNRTVNYEGEVAYTMDNDLTLYVTTATSTLSGKFYEPDVRAPKARRGYGYGDAWAEQEQKELEKARVQHIVDLCDACHPNFVANLAEYIRSDMYLRSVPLVMVASLAQRGLLNKETVARVVQRPDEITELLAVWQYVSGKPDLKAMPNSLKKGEALAFQRLIQGKTFEDAAYGVGKYNRGGRGQVTFLDAMRLVHPRPLNDIQNQVFEAIKKDAVPTPYTWEVAISAAGADPAAKRKAWEDILDAGKLPYMAALRNIRNIIQADVGAPYIRKLVDILTNEKLILKSKQFPFRWFAAYKMLRKEGLGNVYMKSIYEALNTAIKTSVLNIPGFDDIKDSRFLIAMDTSASMNHPFSAKSAIMRHEIAIVLGLLLQTKLDFVTVGAFAEGWKVYPPTSDILGAVGTTVGKIGEVGHSTNGYKVVKWARETKTVYDYIALFSDMQLWNSDNPYGYGYDRSAFEAEWNAYRSQVNPNAKLALFDLAGYGTTPIDVSRKDVYPIAGFSEKIFQVLPKLAAGEEFLKQFHKPV